MRTLTLLLSLLALGALGLVAYGGGDDDEATAASGTEATAAPKAETTVSVSRFGSKSCRALGAHDPNISPVRVEVVEGYFPCRVARRVIKGQHTAWSCHGLPPQFVCRKTIRSHFPNNQGSGSG
jgi:hypothetical protein